jgi:DNA end-binding protein Ku
VPRAIWTGSISFGLVNVPIRMYGAIDEQDLGFDLIHEKDGGHIGYQKYCKLEDELVPSDEIVKGYEVEKGEYVYLTDEDFEAAEAENHKTIDIRDFVPYEEIDPIYFERTYYLGPQEGAEKVYALLVRAMEESGLAAIAKYVLRDRQHLGCLRVRDGVILLEKMFFADEIRPTDELAPGDAKVDKRELEMAAELIDRFSGSFEPEKYEDTYRERLLEIVEAKHKGKEIHAEAVAEPEEPEDLLAALRASLEAARSERGGSRRATPRKPARKSGGASSKRKDKAKSRGKR